MKEYTLTKDQQIIYDSETKNMLISAGAGSGKTFILTQRVIHLLRDKNYRLKDMIILTFTDLAAGEMKSRIIKELKKENKQDLDDELKHIDEASIQTFDSFCHDFVTKYSCFSKFPKVFEIGDSSMFKMIECGILKDILSPYFIQALPAFDEFIDIFDISTESRIYDYFYDLYSSIQNIINHEDYIKTYVNNYFSNSYYETITNRLISIIDEKINFILSTNVPPYLEKVNDFVKTVKDTLNDILNSSDFDYIINKFNTVKDLSTPVIRLTDESKKEELKTAFESFKDTFKDLKNLLTFNSKEELLENYINKKPIAQFIMSVLEELDIKTKAYKMEHSIYSFIDIEKETIRILEEHPEIGTYYKETIKEILIDEYQDTNDIQNKIVSLISNNNVIVVGDIKQSIYRFRNANPNIFKSIYDDYKMNPKKGEVVELYDNFRSRKSEVLDIVNDAFLNIKNYPSVNMDYLDQKMGYGRIEYSEFEPESNKFKIFEIDPKEENEYEVIARDIYERLNNGQMVYDPLTHEKRKAEPRDFMILSFDNRHLLDMAYKLKDYNIESKVYGAKEFIKTKEVVFLKNILKLIYLFENNLFENSEFNLTLLSVLRSFVVGSCADMIVDYLDRTKYESNKDALIALYKPLYDKMIYLVEVLHKYNMYYALKEAIKIFDVYQKLMTLKDYEEMEIRVTQILDTIKTLANSKMSLKDAIEYFDYLKMEDKDIEIKQNDLDSLNYVSLMTIHKSKGLEKPFIYMIRLYSPMRITIPAFSKDYGIIYKKESINDQLFEIFESLEQRRERIRLLYVALTRAKESLTLIFNTNIKSFNRELNQAKSHQMLLLMNNDYSKYYKSVDYSKIPKLKDEVVETYDNTVNYHFFEVKPKEKIIKTKASHDLYDENEEVFKALERGMEVHSYFELISFKDNIEAQMEKYEIPVADKPLLRAFKEQDIFKENIIREYHELPYYKNNTKGIIDYIVETDNKFMIIDFKLKNIDDILYVSQLKAYKEYLQTRVNKKIETYLYSIMDRTLKKIDTTL